MITCSKCGHENSDDAQFCTSCHNILLYKCPNCWNLQRHAGKCDKCGVDLAVAWNVQAATAMAGAIKEEETNVAKSGQDLQNTVQMAEMAVLSPTNFLAAIGLQFAWRWLSNYFSRK
jgi:uncharacterized membrane protein YvbJ